MDTNQRIRELADMFQLTKTKNGTWTFDLPPIRTGGPLPYMPVRPRRVRDRQRGARHLPGGHRTPGASRRQARSSHSTVRVVRASRR